MKARTAIAKTSAFVGLSGYIFWFAAPLSELIMREPNWWVFGIFCLTLSAYLVSLLFKRVSVRTDTVLRLFVRYLVGAAASYLPMAIVVLCGVQLCLRLTPKHGPNNEGVQLAVLMTLWVPLWELPLGGAMGMVKRKNHASRAT